jgi:phosphate transport system permease protein
VAIVGKFGLTQEQLRSRDSSRQVGSGLYSIWLAACLAVIGLVIVLVIGTILVKGLPSVTWEFLSTSPRDGMSKGGIWPQIRGSMLLMAGTFLFVLPVGVLGGVFLAEYAGSGRFARLVRGCVTSLAGTPSIIFGLFGLAVFVLAFDWKISLLAGWATLAAFAMPVIVLSTEQAIKAVPDSLVEGSLALGLTKWQTIWRVVLPNALPGIVTGVVLSSGRAAGEAAPIFLTAGIYYRSGEPPQGVDMVRSGIENLPYHLAEGYRQGGNIPPSIIWGTCVVLLLLVLAINLGAILVRARVQRKRIA